MKDEFVEISGKKIKVVNNTLKLNKRQIKDIKEIQGFQKLSKVKVLWLNENSITEIKDLEKFTYLEELNLRKNRIKEIKGLENLKKLQILDLRENLIKEIKGLESLSNLQMLRLSKNRITQITNLDGLKNLKFLYLSENKINELGGFESLTNLQELWLNNNEIAEIKGFENLKNLKKLYLRENKINEIKGLDSLINLEELFLLKNNITAIRGLEHLKNLKKLVLSDNPINQREKEILNRKLHEIIGYCEIKSKKKAEKRKLTEEKIKYGKYYQMILDAIINKEIKNLESLSGDPEFMEINVREVLLKLVNIPGDLTEYVEKNKASIKTFFEAKLQILVPDYRLTAQLRLYLRTLLNEFKEKEILDKILFDEIIEGIFQFNSNEIFYITNKRGIIIGKKYITPPKKNIADFAAPSVQISGSQSLRSQESSSEKVLVSFIDIFPISKLITINLEETIKKEQSQYSHTLTFEMHHDSRPLKKVFNVEEKFLHHVWRMCKYMVE